MGKLLAVVLTPLRFPVLQAFPGLPDNPAVIQAMVMLKRLVFPSPGESGLLFDYSGCDFNKKKKQPKFGPTFRGKVFRHPYSHSN